MDVMLIVIIKFFLHIFRFNQWLPSMGCMWYK